MPEPDPKLHPCPPGSEITTDSECGKAAKDLGQTHIPAIRFTLKIPGDGEECPSDNCSCFYDSGNARIGMVPHIWLGDSVHFNHFKLNHQKAVCHISC